ncbi:hypothetical protein C5167_041932 [Papaver somniferum]|nr:hypothetical protein C5167_041932 [Papaver somniferum]
MKYKKIEMRMLKNQFSSDKKSLLTKKQGIRIQISTTETLEDARVISDENVQIVRAIMESEEGCNDI